MNKQDTHNSSLLKRWLAHPLTKGKDIDSPETTLLRVAIIKSKPFLRKIYEEWYSWIRSEVSTIPSSLPVLELGSGAGFLPEKVDNLLTSEIFYLNGVRLVLDAQQLPFAKGSLNAIVMTNVLHHIPNASQMFSEAHRCLTPQGKVVMLEPWLTPWSSFVYNRLHHEPVDESNTSWRIDGEGPLSRANTALPWILFQRDRSLFQTRFPALRIDEVTPYMPLRYLVSGGISLRSLMPAWTFSLWTLVEWLLQPFRNWTGMFVKITLTHTPKEIS